MARHVLEIERRADVLDRLVEPRVRVEQTQPLLPVEQRHGFLRAGQDAQAARTRDLLDLFRGLEIPPERLEHEGRRDRDQGRQHRRDDKGLVGLRERRLARRLGIGHDPGDRLDHLLPRAGFAEADQEGLMQLALRLGLTLQLAQLDLALIDVDGFVLEPAKAALQGRELGARHGDLVGQALDDLVDLVGHPAAQVAHLGGDLDHLRMLGAVTGAEIGQLALQIRLALLQAHDGR